MSHPRYHDGHNVLRWLLAALIVALAGCATPIREPLPPPAPPVAESVWREVDRDIGAASETAAGAAGRFARDRMEQWKHLILNKHETDFIPWFSSYWTQQWLTIKVAWYKLSTGESDDPAVSQLAAYLQTQYQERVLAPVARSIAPENIRGQATRFYVLRLSEQLDAIPPRYGIAPFQFDQHLRTIPAISLGASPEHVASLYQLSRSRPIDELPAYIALRKQTARTSGDAVSTPSATHVSPVARRASEKLMTRLAISSGTSAASALAGGIAGAVISLGAAGIGIVLHESERGYQEAQLRESLNAALDEMWQALMDDPQRGVMAEIYHIADQIEKCCPQTFAQPVELGELPDETHLPELQALPDDTEQAEDIIEETILGD